MIIESDKNTQIKKLKRLKQKKYRELDKSFYVEGLRLVRDGLQNGLIPKSLFVSENFDISCLENYIDLRTEINIVKESIFKSISDTNTPQGIIAVFNKYENENNYFENRNRFLYLDRIQDPGNLGTIIRSADAFGIEAIFLNKGCVDIYNSKVIRSTMGAVFHIPLYCIEDEEVFLGEIHKNDIECAGLIVNGDMCIEDYSIKNKTMIFLGNEANGLSELLIKHMDYKLFINMTGKAESLNAAMAATVALYILQK